MGRKESNRLATIDAVATAITGKKVVHIGSKRDQTLDSIHAKTFHDVIHEIGHWLAASPEEKLSPNLGFDEPDTDEAWAAVREFQAICYHSLIVGGLVDLGLISGDDDRGYVEFLEMAADALIDGKAEVSRPLHMHLAAQGAQDVIRLYRINIEANLATV